MPFGDSNRPREIYPATPFLFLQNRGTTLSWNSNVAFIWNTEAINTQDFVYKTGKSKIFIRTSGFYEIIYELSVYLYSGSMTYTEFGIYQNGVLLDGSVGAVTFPNGYPSAVSVHYYRYLNSGDYLQLVSAIGAGGGTLKTLPDTVRFIIKFMPQKGWNNSRGGAESYRGGVDR